MFLFSHWLNLNINTRHKIAAQFGIVKRGSTEVVDNVISNDGYKVKDIEEALNIDALQTYLNTQEADMTKLWVMLINKIEGREYVDDIQPPVQEPKIEVKKNKGGRPRKTNA